MSIKRALTDYPIHKFLAEGLKLLRSLVFDQPVQPGSTVTVALAAEKNPNWVGVYLFGVTAYPAGDNGLGQFLGYGRINFYGN